jgi:hypothetical protein
MEPKKPPQISNTEWGMIIAILLIIDGLQILFDLVAIGLLVNRVIDFTVGYLLIFYTLMRGLKLTKPSRMGGILVTFILEFIGIGDVLPLWCMDGILNMWAYKKEVREYEKAMAQYNQAQAEQQKSQAEQPVYENKIAA